MAKVSVGLRGWRFEESEIFTEDGNWRPFDEMHDEDRERLLRLRTLVTKPCDACFLVHGEEDIERCREAEIVYGEPKSEVVLCDEHEADFRYWFSEAGGDDYRGEDELQDAFHGWFDDGNRAPEAFGGVDHVDTDPEALPDPPNPNDDEDRYRITLRDAMEPEETDLDEDALDDIDLSADYPS
ncbi:MULTISPECIES: hypothetical protein [Halostella]|uniref:hypothetical protein n=1 Tax=Halostella TaxID=1843185 RepID=UPI001081055C|nr:MULTISPECIES: hypothetical protein [Halostella]